MFASLRDEALAVALCGGYRRIFWFRIDGNAEYAFELEAFGPIEPFEIEVV